jgi:tetratricopeptide (TPR) repeat protein
MRQLKLLALMVLCGAAVPVAAQQRTDKALAKLEQARQANPSSVAANRSLGIWYYKQNRYAEARTALDMARKLDPKDGVSALYAGMAAEAMEDYTGAKDAYNTYLQVGKTRSVRSDISKRLVALSRKELHAAAKSAIANESRIAQQPGDVNQVAVMPMTFSGTDQTLAPLGRGMTDLLIGDLARSSQVQLLERDRIQAIVDELALAQSGQTDAASSVRAGKLVRAGRVVQGAITQTGTRNLTVNAAVLNVASSQQQGRDVTASDVLDQIFAMEKNIALGIFDQLGVRLSAADRTALEQRPTRSLQAFLAYSNGLVAADNGRYDEAAKFFDQARSIDPGFAQALQKAQSARAAQQGAAVTNAKVESGLRGGSEGAAVATTSSTGIGSTLANAVGDINPSAANNVNVGTGGTQGQAPPPARDATAEKTGTDQPATKTGTVSIVIKRP